MRRARLRCADGPKSAACLRSEASDPPPSLSGRAWVSLRSDPGWTPARVQPEASLDAFASGCERSGWREQRGALAACRQTGCSRPSLFRWIAAYEAEGIPGLMRLTPATSAATGVPAWVEWVVITVRLLRTGTPSVSPPRWSDGRSTASATTTSTGCWQPMARPRQRDARARAAV